MLWGQGAEWAREFVGASVVCVMVFFFATLVFAQNIKVGPDNKEVQAKDVCKNDSVVFVTVGGLTDYNKDGKATKWEGADAKPYVDAWCPHYAAGAAKASGREPTEAEKTANAFQSVCPTAGNKSDGQNDQCTVVHCLGPISASQIGAYLQNRYNATFNGAAHDPKSIPPGCSVVSATKSTFASKVGSNKTVITQMADWYAQKGLSVTEGKIIDAIKGAPLTYGKMVSDAFLDSFKNAKENFKEIAGSDAELLKLIQPNADAGTKAFEKFYLDANLKDIDTIDRNSPDSGKKTIPGDPDAKKYKTDTTFYDRTPSTPPPGAKQDGLTGLLNSLLGGQSAQDPYCVTNANPVVVEQRPATPGCLNYKPNAQQQCSPLLQMMSRCPQGSYNPSNPQNPYGYPQPQCQIQVSPSQVSPGQPVTLQWQSTGAQQAYISVLGQVGPTGSTQVTPQTSTTYSMQVQGQVPGTNSYSMLQGQCQAQVTVGSTTPGTEDPDPGMPQAQISCEPRTADVGMQVVISFACQNSTTSSGNNFSTDNELSGSSVETVATPSLGSNGVTYGLTCSKDGQTQSAQCTVNINKTAIVLVSNPKQIASGEHANLGWVTSGMESCTISSPNLSAFTGENADNTSPSGVAKTPVLTSDTTFELLCTTKGGNTRKAEVTVDVQ